MVSKEQLDKRLSEMHTKLDEEVAALEDKKAEYRDNLDREQRIEAEMLSMGNQALHQTFRAALADMARGSATGQDLISLYETFCHEYGLTP